MSKVKFAVVGSRSFNNYATLKSILDVIVQIHNGPENIHIISGGAKGADSLAEEYAKSKGIELTIVRPEWDKYGKQAGMIRNKEMANMCDRVIAFWDNKSKGTAHTIEYSKSIGIAPYIVYI